MNIMSRYALRLVGIGAFAIAFPHLDRRPIPRIALPWR
jgi:hypothetical protein